MELKQSRFGQPPAQPQLDNWGPLLVPAGHFFMMGDNRDNSTDSRVLSAMGYIPLQNIYGRAALIYASRDRQRVGTMVR